MANSFTITAARQLSMYASTSLVITGFRTSHKILTAVAEWDYVTCCYTGKLCCKKGVIGLCWKELLIRFTACAFRKMLSIYVFSYFPFGFEGRTWDLIVSVPDHCLSFYFTLLYIILESGINRGKIILPGILFDQTLTDSFFLIKESINGIFWLSNTQVCLSIRFVQNPLAQTLFKLFDFHESRNYREVNIRYCCAQFRKVVTATNASRRTLAATPDLWEIHRYTN